MSSIEERVKKIIVEQLGVKPEDVVPEASFVEDEDAENRPTVQHAIDYIESHS